MSPELDEQTATDAESTVTCAGQALTPNSKTMTPPRMTPQGLEVERARDTYWKSPEKESSSIFSKEAVTILYFLWDHAGLVFCH